MKQPRRLPVHRSLVRPVLFAGGERKLVMLNYTIIVVLLFGAGLNALTISTAIFLATFGHIVLVKFASYDPQFSQIYSRYRHYQEWYSAQPSVFCNHHPVKPSVTKGVRP